MEKRIAAFTVFTFLLFAVSTARIALDQVSSVLTDDVSKSSTENIDVADSNVDLLTEPTEKSKSDLDQSTTTDRLPESENTQTFYVNTIESTPRLSFARLRPINRHFIDRSTRIPLRFVRRQPCRKFQKKFMIQRAKMLYGDDVVLSSKTYSFDPKTLGDQVIPTKYLEFKHNYGDRHRHHHDHHHDKDDQVIPTKYLEFKHNYGDRHRYHHDHHHDKDEEFEIKYEYDREKFDQHKEKNKREHKGGFMRGIRKFLKHTFG